MSWHVCTAGAGTHTEQQKVNSDYIIITVQQGQAGAQAGTGRTGPHEQSHGHSRDTPQAHRTARHEGCTHRAADTPGMYMYRVNIRTQHGALQAVYGGTVGCSDSY